MGGLASKYHYLTLGLLAFCVLVGFYVVYRLRRGVEEDSGSTSEKELVGPLEKAFYAGLMDEAEYRRIKESVAKNRPEPDGAKPAAVRARPAPKRADDPPPPQVLG